MIWLLFIAMFNLSQSINRHLQHPDDKIFNLVLADIISYHNRPVHNISDLKQKEDKHLKGRAWELFCQAWLRARNKYQNVWLLSEVPVEIRQSLKLSKLDCGIDLVVQTQTGFISVQCKFREKGKLLPWKSVDSFVGLTLLTGPWQGGIIMTNLAGIGRKQVPVEGKFKCCGYKTFAKTSREVWIRMAQITPIPVVQPANQTTNQPTPNPTLQQLRELRLKALSP